MWKFLRSKSIWVALSGLMLAAGTLFTAVDDAKAETGLDTVRRTHVATSCSLYPNMYAAILSGKSGGGNAWEWNWKNNGASGYYELFALHEWPDGGKLWFCGVGGDTQLDADGNPYPATNGLWNKTPKKLWSGYIANGQTQYVDLSFYNFIGIGKYVYFFFDRNLNNTVNTSCKKKSTLY